MRLQAISESEARDLLRQQLVGSGECDQLAMDCAKLRSCLWALSGGTQPVHVLRLLNFVAVGEDADFRTRLREVLEELSDAGDVAELANGRWIPAPTRQVLLGTVDDARLLIGGLPSSTLPWGLRNSIEHYGVFRRLKGPHLPAQLELPSEERTSWMGEAPAELLVWTQSVFEGQYEAARDEEHYIHYYAPELFSPNTPQAIRWVPRPDRLSGRYLAEQTLAFGMKRALAVEVVSGRLTRLMVLRCGDLRRLKYGLDRLAHKSVAVEVQDRGDTVTLVLKSELPRPERRLFAALGTLTVLDGSYYPRMWHFPKEYGAEIGERLSALGVRLFARAGQ
jgi:hypothetical protein